MLKAFLHLSVISGVIFVGLGNKVDGDGGRADNPAGGGQVAATEAAVPLVWGKMDEGTGLRVNMSVSGEGKIVPGEKIAGTIRVENQRAATAEIKGAFAWIFVAVNKQTGYYTEQIALDGVPPAGMGEKIAGSDSGEKAELGVDLGTLKVFAYDKGLKMVGGYPVAEEGAGAVGSVGKVLPVGTVRMRCMVYVPGSKTLLQGNTVVVAVGEPDLSKLAPADREKIVGELMGLFRGDPVAGNSGYKRAMKYGPVLLPDALKAMEDAKLSEAGKQWLAATVCDLTAEALAKQEGGNNPQVQEAIGKLQHWVEKKIAAEVIAYYGAKIRDKKLEGVILGAAEKNPGVAAWAARGYAGRKDDEQTRKKLIDQVLSKGNVEARSNLVPALVMNPDKIGISALKKLLEDSDAAVRTATAGGIAKAKIKEPELVGALIGALKHSDDETRGSACAALAAITNRLGENLSWGPENPLAKEQKDAIVAGWKKWYGENMGK